MASIITNIISSLVWSRSLKYAIQHDDFRGYMRRRRVVMRDMAVEDTRHFANYLSICAIVKNEGAYLPEWLEYHKMLGVDKFYIYDNESTDDTHNILQSYIADGTVVYRKIRGQGKQLDAYNDCLKRVMYKTKWLGFIDLDEFIVPLQSDRIPDMLHEFEGYPALAIHWLLYGDSGHKTKTRGLVVERFTRHAVTNFEKNTHVKIILNPRQTYFMKVHTGVFISHNQAVNENFEPAPHSRNKNITMSRIRINHYFGKSYAEYMEKRARGSNVPTAQYVRHDFDIHNKNDVNDSTMHKYVSPIKTELKKRGLL